MSIEFTRIPDSEVHPVSRFGFDPIPGNNGEYVWLEESRTYVPGRYTYGYDIETGRFVRTGYVLK